MGHLLWLVFQVIFLQILKMVNHQVQQGVCFISGANWFLLHPLPIPSFLHGKQMTPWDGEFFSPHCQHSELVLMSLKCTRPQIRMALPRKMSSPKSRWWNSFWPWWFFSSRPGPSFASFVPPMRCLTKRVKWWQLQGFPHQFAPTKLTSSCNPSSFKKPPKTQKTNSQQTERTWFFDVSRLFWFKGSMGHGFLILFLWWKTLPKSYPKCSMSSIFGWFVR